MMNEFGLMRRSGGQMIASAGDKVSALGVVLCIARVQDAEELTSLALAVGAKASLLIPPSSC